MKTYVLSLDTERFNKQRTALEAAGIYDVQKIDGVLGKNELQNPNLTPVCRASCPYSLIGCSLGHRKIHEHFIDNDPNDVCLVLEDDAFPLFKDKSEIEALVSTNTSSPDWDILQLHCDGMFNRSCSSDRPNVTSGSTAAYFITKEGALKMLDQQVYTYSDIQTNLDSRINKKKTPTNYFYTDERKSMNRIDGGGGGWFNFLMPHGEKTYDNLFSMKVVRLPGTSTELTFYNVVALLVGILIIITAAYLHGCRRHR